MFARNSIKIGRLHKTCSFFYNNNLMQFQITSSFFIFLVSGGWGSGDVILFSGGVVLVNNPEEVSEFADKIPGLLSLSTLDEFRWRCWDIGDKDRVWKQAICKMHFLCLFLSYHEFILIVSKYFGNTNIIC